MRRDLLIMNDAALKNCTVSLRCASQSGELSLTFLLGVHRYSQAQNVA